jgi:hypothetical protein
MPVDVQAHDNAFRSAKLLLLDADKEDRAGHFKSALLLYKQGCSELLVALQNGNDKQRAGYKAALGRYLSRAEAIKGLMKQRERVEELGNWATELFGAGAELVSATGAMVQPAAATDGVAVVVFAHVAFQGGFEQQTEELLAGLAALHERLMEARAARAGAAATTMTPASPTTPTASAADANLHHNGSMQVVLLTSSVAQDAFHALHQQKLGACALAVPWENKRLAAKVAAHFGVDPQISSAVVVNNANGKVIRRACTVQEIGGPHTWFPQQRQQQQQQQQPQQQQQQQQQLPHQQTQSQQQTQTQQQQQQQTQQQHQSGRLHRGTGNIVGPKDDAWMYKMFGNHLRQSGGSAVPPAEVRFASLPIVQYTNRRLVFVLLVG